MGRYRISNESFALTCRNFSNALPRSPLNFRVLQSRLPTATHPVTVNPSALDGNPDIMPANDICPRNASATDKGCPIATTDVIRK
jgi:hypothetical protein